MKFFSSHFPTSHWSLLFYNMFIFFSGMQCICIRKFLISFDKKKKPTNFLLDQFVLVDSVQTMILFYFLNSN